MASSTSSSSSSSSSSSLSYSDKLFAPDAARLAALVAAMPWARDGSERHFTKVKVSAVAAMRMMAHAASGVEKGLTSATRMPIEVMGLVEGHVDTGEERCLVVTDVFPLPVEGTETTVMSENLEVMNHMIALGEALEKTRNETPPYFMGWYHSHPFDVSVNSNCFLSATDVSTQLSWQLQEDKNGNPWVALVVDPLRGVAKGRPEVGAFRCYPPSFTPAKGLAPDGEVWADEKARNARWGESCVSYYSLEVEYCISSSSAALMGTIARDFMWTRVLSSSATLEAENRDRVPERLHRLGDKVDAYEMAVAAGQTGMQFGRSVSSMSGVLGDGGVTWSRKGGGGAGAGGFGGVGGAGSGAAVRSEIAEAATGAAELASELLRGQGAQLIKLAVFNERVEAAGDLKMLQLAGELDRRVT